MIVILASVCDSPARALAALWAGHDARLMTCRDLSTAGWRYYPGDLSASRAVIDGQITPFEEIEGVLVRLPSVSEDELPHISASDRSYVASEMTAFLTAWLSEATFPVINRPTPTCLMGPNWRPEQWQCAARRAGARVRPMTRLLACAIPRGPLPNELQEPAASYPAFERGNDCAHACGEAERKEAAQTRGSADLKRYSAVCLCLHGPHNRVDEFREFAKKCGEAGALAIGVADETYYSSEAVIPAVEGLLRCSSRDLLSFLRSHLPQT